MSSFGEKKAVQFAKEQGQQFVEFTRRQLARIYPAGTRIDSSNYDPVALWNAGCQLGKFCSGLKQQTNCNSAVITTRHPKSGILRKKFSFMGRELSK